VIVRNTIIEPQHTGQFSPSGAIEGIVQRFLVPGSFIVPWCQR
jgi:hypothetical protein